MGNRWSPVFDCLISRMSSPRFSRQSVSKERPDLEENLDRTAGRNKYAMRWKRVRDQVEEAKGGGYGQIVEKEKDRGKQKGSRRC